MAIGEDAGVLAAMEEPSTRLLTCPLPMIDTLEGEDMRLEGELLFLAKGVDRGDVAVDDAGVNIPEFCSL